MKPHFRILALCSLLFFLTSLPFAQDIIQVSNTPGQAEMPFVKVMKDGRIMFVYGEGHHFNSDSTLYFRIHNPVSGSWSAEEKAVQRISSSAYAQLAEDFEGNLHMSYHDGNASSNRDIHYAKFDFNQFAWKPQKLANRLYWMYKSPLQSFSRSRAVPLPSAYPPVYIFCSIRSPFVPKIRVATKSVLAVPLKIFRCKWNEVQSST